MTRHEVPRLKPEPRPAPQMMNACQSGGCGGGAPAPQKAPPVFSTVRVNGVEIDPDAIAQEMQHHPASDADAAWRGAARALAVRELLLQEARRLDMASPAAGDEMDEDALISDLLESGVVPEEAGDEECRRYYEANRQRFRTPDLFEASHILIEPDGDGVEAWSTAGIQARRIATEVGDDPTAFAAAAREYSGCPSAQQDGSLGQVRRGELVAEVQQAIEALSPGETCRRPIRSGFGWHVIRLARCIEGQILPFEAVHEKIADMMAARAWTMGAARYVADLAQRSEVEGIVIEPEVGS
ncbi:peptidylprolyl isomerase [Jannaschia rubra]|uniref:Parvulin-like PPIase n=1 Tax=Jannaschia rubra TaxID=282197 RepID=A0A0M6XT70_9RHOB|nr:peptidylprolyl isomerase [Jannaschia rubra]CTQ34349.1 Foldase protein PrsA precursor [Jannaschia rubra]SFG63095.1 peptidyl-prolyl cis-trans isomerase C [Jannaschia rubra]